MPKPRRNLHSTAAETETPPDSLSASQHICRVKSAAGKNLYHVEMPDATPLLVELAQRFRSTIWIKRGSYVVVDTATLAERENKIGGEIVNVVRGDKAWVKMPWWPSEFKLERHSAYDAADGSDEDESNVGKMPPSVDSSDDD